MKSLKELLQETKPYTEENYFKNWWYLLTSLLLWGLAVYGTTRVDFSLGFRVFWSVLAGLIAVRLFIFFHDYHHGAIFRKSKLGPLLINLFGMHILTPPNVWNRSHNYHHQKNAQMATAGIGSFPVMTVDQYRKSNSKIRLMYRMARHPLTILFGYFTVFIGGMLIKSFLKDPKRHWDSAASLIIHVSLLAYLFGIGRADLAILSVMIPQFIASALGGYLFYIQHNFPDIKMKGRQDWDFLFAALRSSSYMTGNPIVHWFTGNIGYHHVHHLNSRIPFYNLPTAMAGVSELQNPGKTSLAPSDIAKCLKLKLWDPDKDRMVGFDSANDLRPVSLVNSP